MDLFSKLYSPKRAETLIAFKGEAWMHSSKHSLAESSREVLVTPVARLLR